MAQASVLLQALKEEHEDVLQALITIDDIIVSWTDYPNLPWILTVVPQWDCMLLYAVDFEEVPSGMGVCFYPKFRRLFDKDFYKTGTPGRTWQDSIETFLEKNRQPECFIDMKTLFTTLDTHLHSGHDNQANISFRRRLSCISVDDLSSRSFDGTSPTSTKRQTIPSKVEQIHAVGLSNTKNQNLCFMNSVSQALTHSFYNGKLRPLLKQLSQRECADQNIARLQPVVKGLALLLEALSMGHGNERNGASDPEILMNEFRLALSVVSESNVQKPGSAAKQMQQDVHEYLTFLLQTLESVAATSEQRCINFDTFDELVKGSAMVFEVMADLQWNERFSVGAAQFAASLAFQTITAYYCGQCRRPVQYRPDINNILSLSVGSEISETTVQNLFNETISTESLDSWKCGSCNSTHPDTSRTSKFFRLPSYLIVHMVRTQIDMRTGEIGKSLRPVKIGNITCELPTQLIPRQSSAKKHSLVSYAPVSVVTHIGVEMRSGHYTTYSSIEGNTILFDDEKISNYGTSVPDKEKDTMDRNSALIFYIRK
eukprot:CFRG1901T1